MLPTLARRANYGTRFGGAGGVQPWRQRVEYETFRSKYGPQYKIQPHFHGINPTNGTRYLIMTGLFGMSAGIFALVFFDEVPRVRKDILQKIPLVGGYFFRETPPEDNPF